MTTPHAERMRKQPGHHTALMVLGTCGPLLGLLAVPAMLLAYAVSGNMPEQEQRFILNMIYVWAGFCIGSPLLLWATWLFSRRMALWVSILNVGVVAMPAVLLTVLSLVLPFIG